MLPLINEVRHILSHLLPTPSHHRPSLPTGCQSLTTLPSRTPKSSACPRELLWSTNHNDNKIITYIFKSAFLTTSIKDYLTQSKSDVITFRNLWDREVAKLWFFCLFQRMDRSVSMSVRPAPENNMFSLFHLFLKPSVNSPCFAISPAFDMCFVVTAMRDRKAFTCSTSSPRVNPAPSW